jgi:peptidoglycan hydrolase CwlO-like protein
MRLRNASERLSRFFHREVGRFLALAVLLGLTGGFSLAAPVYGDTVQQQIDAANAQIQSLQNQISQYEKTLSDLGNQKQSLQNEIKLLDVSRQKVNANISVTQAKINQTSLELTQLGGAITDKQSRIESDTSSIGESLRGVNQTDENTLVEQLLTSNGLLEAWNDVSQTATLNAALRDDVNDLTVTKTSLTKDYNATQVEQAQLVTLKKQLAAQQAQLDQNRKQKNALLAQTNNSEATYQELLADAKAELASFAAFVANAGGAGILGQETVCDSWGCYYNQRDADWGDMFLSGTKDRLAAAGCLVTSMAMVMTHYGYRNVTPVVINSDPSNFSAVGGLLLKTVSAGGVSATRTNESVSTKTIDAILAKGTPVIVGLHAYGGTHFVVLVKDTGSDYLMRDPYIQNGKDISFLAHYSFKNIYEVNRVVINS